MKAQDLLLCASKMWERGPIIPPKHVNYMKVRKHWLQSIKCFNVLYFKGYSEESCAAAPGHVNDISAQGWTHTLRIFSPGAHCPQCHWTTPLSSPSSSSSVWWSDCVPPNRSESETLQWDNHENRANLHWLIQLNREEGKISELICTRTDNWLTYFTLWRVILPSCNFNYQKFTVLSLILLCGEYIVLSSDPFWSLNSTKSFFRAM